MHAFNRVVCLIDVTDSVSLEITTVRINRLDGIDLLKQAPVGG